MGINYWTLCQACGVLKRQMKINKSDMKILLFDIETAPAKGWFWGVWETNVIEVEQHGYMLSFSAKWLGQNKVITYTLNDFKGHKAYSNDDKKLVSKLAELLNEADIVVAQNGDRFDLTTTNTRLIANNLPPIAPLKTIDTLKVARSKFKFLSNKLDDLGNFLGVGRKIAHTGKHLWFGCMANDKKAWAMMKKYNVQDVILLEAVYLKLRPWITNHPNHNFFNGETNKCPNCNSSQLHARGKRRTLTSEYKRYVCKDCGAWSRSNPERISRVSVRN